MLRTLILHENVLNSNLFLETNRFMSFEFLHKLCLERLKLKKTIPLRLRLDLLEAYKFWKRNKEQLKLGAVEAVFTDVYYGPVRLQTRISFKTRVECKPISSNSQNSSTKPGLSETSWTFTQVLIILFLSCLILYFLVVLGYMWYLDLICYKKNLSVTRYGLIYVLNTTLTGSHGSHLGLGVWVDTLADMLVSMKILC